MAIDLGKWSWLADSAIDFGVPALGMAFGIPGPVSTFAVSALKKALGLADNASADTVKNAIEADPETAKTAFQTASDQVTAKYAYLTRLAEVQADVAKTNITEVNETIRAEVSAAASTPDGWWGQWRTWMAYELMFECPFWAVLIVWCVIYGKINELNAAAGILTVWWAARFGVLGVHVWTGSNERQTAITGTAPTGALANVAAVITAKKK